MANKEQTIALAGIFQALTLVQSIAYRGNFDLANYGTSINSILKTDARDTMAVFGAGPEVLRLGLKSLLINLETGNKSPQTIELTRYFIGVTSLEKKLGRAGDTMDKLARGIERVKQQTEHFPPEHENIAASLANLYKQTISGLGPKIMINGERDHLHNKKHAARIRALLLAAIRAAVLWRQKGGVRWKIVFERGKICKLAENLLKQADVDTAVQPAQ